MITIIFVEQHVTIVQMVLFNPDTYIQNHGSAYKYVSSNCCMPEVMISICRTEPSSLWSV